MERDSRTIAAIRALGYCGSACLRRCMCRELPCPLLTWLVLEHRISYLEAQEGHTQGVLVGSTGSLAGVILAGELRDLLAKLHCPFQAFDTEMLNSAFLDRLTEFLVSELQAVRILQYRDTHKGEKARDDATEKEQRKELLEDVEAEENQEFKTARLDEGKGEKEKLRQEFSLLLQALNLDPSSQLCHVTAQVESRLAMLAEAVLPGPLLKTSLNSDQWSRIQQINKALTRDYECRKHMLIKRFQVTLQSFAWGEKGQEHSMMTPPSSFSTDSNVSMSLLLATREDQSRIFPVKAGCSTMVHKVLMESVPDRGGRPGEIEPPMPTWEDRREGGGRSHRGRQQRHWGSGKKSKNKKKQ
ncbi:protein FAM98A-like [Arapaima gigas]